MHNDLIIHFKHVWASYRIEPVLRDFDWCWRENEQWAILGGNAAGKSAIAHLITGQLRPQRGSIIRQDKLPPHHDIVHLSFELQRQLIDHDVRFDDSEVRADAFDVGTTVKRIVLQNQPEDQRFHDIVRRCHIDHILDHGIRFVSTGESRKTLLARALLQQPYMLILDNPFEGLDKIAQLELKELIDQLLKAASVSAPKVLLLTQQADEIPSSVSHVLWLEQGQLQSLGERTEVLSKAHHQTQSLLIKELPPATERRYHVSEQLPLLELNHVNVSYNGKAILTDINWQLDWGQHCCITGPNGAGKSTLLSLLCGDNHKAYGQDIRLFGNLRGSGESIWELKEKFGVVSTQLQLNHIGRTRVADVIASGLYDSIGLYRQCSGQERKIALDWLKVLGLEDIAGQFFNQLSFGQQRLAMLARAMVKSPLILILDEPCLGLDKPHRQLILALIDAIADRGNCHILYVSHTAGEMPRCINQQLVLTPNPKEGFSSSVSKYTH